MGEFNQEKMVEVMINLLTIDLIRLMANLAFVLKEEGNWLLLEILQAAAQGSRSIKIYADDPTQCQTYESILKRYGFNVEPRPINKLEVSW